jgi:hypothetical protein
VVGTLLFSSPVSQAHARSCFVLFEHGFRRLTGEVPSAFGLDADVADGIHLHFAWAGHSLTAMEEAALSGLWPHGGVLLSRTRVNVADVETDLDAYARMMKGGQSWSRAVSCRAAI